MIHLRLIVPDDNLAVVIEHLANHAGVAHVVHLASRSVSPPGELVLCDVSREAANEVVEWLQGLGVHRRGAISIESTEAVISDAAEVAEASAPGHGSDALVWEELEATARDAAELTPSFLVFIAVAAVIAGVGILLDSPVLIVGAMVVGPEYGAVAAVCVSAVRRRRSPASRSR